MRPVIEVFANGKPVNGLFYSQLMSATIRDQSGQESDTLTLVFDNCDYSVEVPAEGTVLDVLFGYDDGDLTSMGKFEVDTITSSGGEGGIILTITAHVVDLRKELKQKSSESFEKTTLGAMLKATFKAAGKTIEVASELASIKIEYEAKHDQSAYDFATRLADKYNAIFKPGGAILLFVPRGSQNKVSGGSMTAVNIDISDCSDWSIETRPRPLYSKVAVKHYSAEKAITEVEEYDFAGGGPVRTLKHKARNKAEAKEMATAEAARLNRARGSGNFTVPGRTDVTAEVDVIATGFGPIENGKWRCKAVEHRFDQSGYTTTIEVESPETPK